MKSEQKIAQYLNEAHASEIGLVRVLPSQIAMTPRGTYRTGLEKHLRETRDHAERLEGAGARARRRQQPVQAASAWPRPDRARGWRSPRPRSISCAAPAAGEGAQERQGRPRDRGAGDRHLHRAGAPGARRRRRRDGQAGRVDPRRRGADARAHHAPSSRSWPTPSSRADVKGSGTSTSRRPAPPTGAARPARTRPGQADRRHGGPSGPRVGAQGARRRARRGHGQGRGRLRAATCRSRATTRSTAEEISAKLGELSQVDLAKVEAYERQHDNRATVTSGSRRCGATSPGRL